MKPIWIVVITVIVTAAVIGGGGYYYLNGKNVKEKNDLQAQIDDLNAKISTAQTALSAATATTGTTSIGSSTTTTDPTAGWKTYSNPTYGFTFKYPADWSQDQVTSSGPALLVFAGPGASKNMERGGPYGIVNVSIYKTLADINTAHKVSSANISDLMTKLSAGSDPYLTSVIKASVGNKNGWYAKAGPNTYGGGDYYYVQSGNTVFEINIFTSNENYNATTLKTLIGAFNFNS